MDVIDISQLPPGFGFHPTDAELVSYYLKRKVMGVKNEYDVIPEVDIYKYEPWDLPAQAGIPFGDCKWHFFNIRDRKYPNGVRSNRATRKGYWKSTGKDRTIRTRDRNIGTKKTLVFHEGRPPMGKRTDWIMHEYYLDEKDCKAAGVPKDVFVLCRVTKRNGLLSEEEEGVQVKSENSNGSSTDPPVLENSATPTNVAIQLEPQQVKPSSLLEHDDLEDWLNELYDDSPVTTVQDAIGTRDDWESDLGFYQSMTEAGDLLPVGDDCLFVEDLLMDWPDIYVDDIPIFYHPQNPVPRDETSATVKAEELNHTDTSDTGIIIRQRTTPSTFSGATPGQRIKLQVHKMETQNPGVVNHTVMLDNSDHHLDPNDFKEVKFRPAFEADAFASLSRTITDEKPKTRSTYVRSRDIKQEEFSQIPQGRYRKRDRAWQEMKRSVRGALREARLVVRRCSSVGRNCLLVGTCLVGAAAMSAYFHQEDA